MRRKPTHPPKTTTWVQLDKETKQLLRDVITHIERDRSALEDYLLVAKLRERLTEKFDL